MDSLGRFRVILWKNFLVRKRHVFLTLVEIVIPIGLFLFVSYARSKIPDFSKQYVNGSTIVEATPASDISTRLNIRELNVLYAPKTDFTKRLLREVQLKLNLYNEGVQGFRNEGELMAHYNRHDGEGTTAVILFSDVDNSVPTKLRYDIRIYEEYVFWNTDRLFLEIKEYVPGIGSETYKDKGFLPLQIALDTSFYETVRKNGPDLSLTFQEFPYPPYTMDSGLRNMFILALPILTLFSFLFLFPSILKRVIEEKSSGIKELMKLNGLEPWMLWASWLIYGFALNIISVVVIVLFLKLKLWGVAYPAVQYCDGVVLALYLLLFCLASISFCFLFSTMFNRPNVAMIIGILFWIILYLVYSNIAGKVDVLTWYLKLPTLLFPNIALHHGYQAISMFELREIRLSFANMFESPTGSSNDVSMGNIMLMLLFDTVFFFLLTVYFDSLYPGPYGIKQKWSYPLQGLHGMFRRNSVAQGGAHSEPEENSKEVSKIRIRDLKKTYGNKTVVDGLSMDIYEGQITGLLGHNGAGKTTTISILTGMIEATSGNVLVRKGENEYVNLREDINRVRHMLSVCPQHNLLFPDLTVLEHLEFFGMLRGSSPAKARRQAVQLLDEKLYLLHKKNKLVHTLSGGMKRKLALGMALMGDPEILILDEPTAGVDIQGRRELWDLILPYKEKKTIIITTHFMEEADHLADRIAIMDHGNLICYDTLMNLKLDEGYYLTVNRVLVEDEHVNQEVEEVVQKIRRFMRDSVAKCEEVNAERNPPKYTYKYRLANDEKGKITQLLARIEGESAEIRKRHGERGAFSFQVSHTTLEDVYLSVGKKAANEVNRKSDDIFNNKAAGASTTWQKFKTLIKKRALFVWKKRLLFLAMVLVSSVIIGLVFNLGGNASADTSKDGPTLNLDLNVYGETGVYYSAAGSHANIIDVHYKHLIRQQRSVPVKVGDVQDEIIRKGVENIAYYKQRMIAGAKFTNKNGSQHVDVMYSNGALHGAPISLNLVMNAVLKTFAGEEYSISASNTPLHSIDSKRAKLEQSGIINQVMWFILFPLAPLFIVSYIMSFTHAEESSNIRKLQHICGVAPWLYWTTNFIWDLFYYLITITISLVTLYFLAFALFMVFGIDAFGNYLLFGSQEFGMLALILLVYACSVPWAYWTSYVHKTIESAYSSYLLLNISVFPILTVCILVMEHSTDEYYEQLAPKLRYVCAAFPQFALTYMASKFAGKFVQNNNWNVKSEREKKLRCSYDSLPCCSPDSAECSAHRSYFSDLDFLWVTCATTFLLVFVLIWSQRIYFLLKKLALNVTPRCGQGADNVKQNSDEEKVISKEIKILDVSAIKQKYLTFKFWPRWKEIIKGISFQVMKGQCVGLLGVNGAGKSTTFRILSREEKEVDGSIALGESATFESMGYCPQQDALIDELTGQELLQIFAELRGEESPEKCVQQWFTALDMLDYAGQPCGTYSGGNKRKLNTCLSLIGVPPLVILDEPTSGVDPKSRRIVWNVLSAIKRAKSSSIVMSSHSMDECEFLCDKLIIIKDGSIEKEGSIPNLQKMQSGFTVKMKLKTNPVHDVIDSANGEDTPLIAVTRVTDAMSKKDLVFETIDERQGFLHVRVKDVNWSEIFKYLEELKNERSDIEDYTITNTSLEDLFLNIAREPLKQEDIKQEHV